MGKRFITITDKFGKRKKVRTEEEKARRKAETEAKKVLKKKYVFGVKLLISLFINLELNNGNPLNIVLKNVKTVGTIVIQIIKGGKTNPGEEIKNYIGKNIYNKLKGWEEPFGRLELKKIEKELENVIGKDINFYMGETMILQEKEEQIRAFKV